MKESISQITINDTTTTSWDVVIIGGGPAGMMAAIQAGKQGAKVLLIEKNKSLGKKLLITGGGRCNLTNAEFDTRTLLSKFKESDKYLFSAFSQWNVHHTLDFFHSNNMPTKVEPGNRVFPSSNKAQSVWDVLVSQIKHYDIHVLSQSPINGFVLENNKIGAVICKNMQIKGASFVLATGGKSHPETGSTGDGFKWLRQIGHKVIDTEAALVPVAIKDSWVKNLQGVTLPEAKITTYLDNVKQQTKKGKILFTHFGLSGPTVLNMSKDIGEIIKYGDVVISLDLLPTLDYSQLNTKLQEVFKENSNKKFKNILSTLLPAAVAPVIVEISGIDPDKQCNSVTREERIHLIKLLKDIRMQVEGLLGLEKAIISSGGVSLDEVDFRTMQSRLFSNLYLVGDILNIDRPSGGFSLQLCWTTGFVAGTHCYKK